LFRSTDRANGAFLRSRRATLPAILIAGSLLFRYSRSKDLILLRYCSISMVQADSGRKRS